VHHFVGGVQTVLLGHFLQHQLVLLEVLEGDVVLGIF
jgi:hypothetical protein